MSNNIEIEGKILVTETEFESLLKYFKRTDEDKIVQINHYIDSQDQQLRKLGFALRIREKINRYVLTLKTPLSEGLLEKDQDISKEVYKSFKYENKFPDGSIKNFLLMLGLNVDSLSIVTSLKTERYDIDYNGGLLSLDKNNLITRENMIIIIIEIPIIISMFLLFLISYFLILFYDLSYLFSFLNE